MKVRISTPEQVVYAGEADSLVIEGDRGQLEILPQHARLVTFVRAGLARVRKGTQVQEFNLNEGVMRIQNDEISILSSRLA